VVTAQCPSMRKWQVLCCSVVVQHAQAVQYDSGCGSSVLQACAGNASRDETATASRVRNARRAGGSDGERCARYSRGNAVRGVRVCVRVLLHRQAAGSAAGRQRACSAWQSKECRWRQQWQRSALQEAQREDLCGVRVRVVSERA